jgi:hypothetical protein
MKLLVMQVPLSYCSFFSLSSSVLLSTLISDTIKLVLFLGRVTKFHTHINQRVQLLFCKGTLILRF